MCGSFGCREILTKLFVIKCDPKLYKTKELRRDKRSKYFPTLTQGDTGTACSADLDASVNERGPESYLSVKCQIKHSYRSIRLDRGWETIAIFHEVVHKDDRDNL